MNPYRTDLKIDKHNLDVEWMNQPQLFIDWGEKEIDAEARVDKAEASLDLIKAQIDSRIRSENKEGKITENFIANAIIQDEKYQLAITELIQAKTQKRIFALARKAFEFQRNKALDRLTDLFLSNYWAEPRGKAEQLITSKIEEKHLDSLNSNPRLIRRKREQNDI